MGSTVCLGRVLERPVARLAEKGVFVDCGVFGELFVPASQVPPELQAGDTLKVFLYQDRGRVLATARRPHLELGMLGRLRVKHVEHGTAYLDLGIPRDLVVPVSEQLRPLREGASALVYLAEDEQGRLFGTQRFDRWLQDRVPAGTFSRGEEVVCVPLSPTPLGWRAAVNDRWLGLIYRDQEYGRIIPGRRCRGYVTALREDGKLDLSLQEPGRSGIEHAAQELLNILEHAGGFLAFDDSSDPRDIDAYLHMSKSRFKKAAGHLYKQRLIVFDAGGIRLTAGAAAPAGAGVIEAGAAQFSGAGLRAAAASGAQDAASAPAAAAAAGPAAETAAESASVAVPGRAAAAASGSAVEAASGPAAETASGRAAAAASGAAAETAAGSAGR